MKKSPRPPEKTYEISYKRPPVASRFQKGHSGNPSGRPRARPDIKDAILKTLLKRIHVRENGVSHQIPALAALAAKAVNEALQGRAKLFVEVFRLLRWITLAGGSGAPCSRHHAAFGHH
jgi:hypothetical protein